MSGGRPAAGETGAGFAPKVAGSGAEPRSSAPKAPVGLELLEQLRPVAPLLLEQVRRALAQLSDDELARQVAQLFQGYPLECARIRRALERAGPPLSSSSTAAPSSSS